MAIDADLKTLATGKNFAALTTLLPSGQPQTQIMWVDADDEHVLINTEVHRQKFKNLQHNPSMSLSLIDPESPFRYLEVAGRLVDVVADPAAAFYLRLQTRYGFPSGAAPADAADRVILTMSVERFTTQ